MKSLKTKLIVTFSIAMAIVMVAIGVITTISVTNIVVPLNNDLTEQVVSARAGEIGKYLEGIEYDMNTWADRNVIRSGDIDTIFEDLQSRQSTLRSDYEMVLYSDLEGNFYSSLGGTGTIADRAYFKEIIAGKNFSLSNPVESRATGEIIFVAAHSVRDNDGKLAGVVAASILLDTFTDVAAEIKIGDNGFAWIADSTGLIFAHPNDEYRLKLNTLESAAQGFVGLEEVGKRMVAGESGIGDYIRENRKTVVIYTPLPNSPGWSMAYTLYEEELMASINSLTLVIVVVVVIGILINAVVTFFIAARTVKPIKATAACARALAEGNLDAPLTVKAKDETGQLAATLDNEVRQAFKSIAQARVVADRQSKYQSAEVDKLLVNLQRLSRGELNCDIVVAEADDVTREQHALFSEIAQNLCSAVNEIKQYIDEISSVLGEMSDGNLCVEITSEYKGDFIALKTSINGIVGALNNVLSEINTAADQVAAGTQQVSDGSQEISQGATEQASSIEELTASVTQIAAQTKQNAMNANTANELSMTAKNDAVAGNDQMKGMQQAMLEINESSASISKIIKVIDDIAFQTNILALNAAVEAARAGVHGKGFAVVAEEVRNLAARSANAAKETTELIEGSIKKVEAGTKIADGTATALTNIVDGVEKAVELVGEIAVASNEQATGIAQVNNGIEQMSQVVQTNSATAEEAAAASEELSSQASMLKNMVAQFKLKGNSNDGGMKALGSAKSENASKPDKAKPKAEGNIVLDENDFGKY
jgi:methyl-accepting chemotaxis protein